MARKRIRKELRTIGDDQPGRRFEATHERHRIRNHAVRITVIGLGCTLMVVAAATFWIPGPNFLLVLAGLALVAGQWRMVARLLDRGELAARRFNDETWEPMSRWRKRLVIVIAWTVFALLVLAALYASGRAGILPDWVPLLR